MSFTLTVSSGSGQSITNYYTKAGCLAPPANGDTTTRKKALRGRRHFRGSWRLLCREGGILEIRLAKRELTAELKKEDDRRETCTITINLLAILGKVVTAWVMLVLTGDRADEKGDPILMRGDNTAAVSWISRCGGAKDKRACILMRMLGRIKVKGGWTHSAEHISGVRNTLAACISLWPRVVLADKVRELTISDDWSEQDIRTRGKGIFDIVLLIKSILSEHDDCL